MRTTMAGPDGVHEAGTIVDLDDQRASELLRKGYAEPAPDWDRVERIAGHSVTQAFKSFVLEDAELVAILQRESKATAFANGFDLEWRLPTDLSCYPDFPSVVRNQTSFWQWDGFARRYPKEACRVFWHRWSRLVGFLQSGKLAARGTHVVSGRMSEIDVFQWGRPSVWVDVRTGDFLEQENQTFITRWTGLSLILPGNQQVKEPSTVSVRQLAGLGLREAFMRFVLQEPQIAAFGRELIAKEGRYSSVFNDGQYPGPFVESLWPLDIDAEALAFDFVRPVVFVVPGPPLPTASVTMRAVAKLIVERMRTLRQALADQILQAEGVFEKTGIFGLINPHQWTRRGMIIDVASGDLLRQIDGGKSVVQWSGIVFKEGTQAAFPASETLHVNDIDYARVRPRSIEHAVRPKSVSKGDPERRRALPSHASIETALTDLWPDGVPAELSIQQRDRQINEWQRTKGVLVTSTRTIRRYFQTKDQARS
jgi:hypothetical protein